MNLKKLALVAAAGTTLLAAAPVFAQSRYDHRWSGTSHTWRAPYYRHHYYPSYYRAPRYYMPPPAVYYTPPYYDPYYYAPPSPVIYGRLPLGHHSSLGFALPLN